MKHIIIITIGLLFFTSLSFSQASSLYQQEAPTISGDDQQALFSKGSSSTERTSLRVSNIFNPGDPMAEQPGGVPNPGDPLPTPVSEAGIVSLALGLGIYGVILFRRKQRDIAAKQ